MEFVLLLCALFVSTTVRIVFGECDRNFGPEGRECVLIHPYYDKHQWASCLSNSYIQTYSNGKQMCRDNSATYCYYQCMVELHHKALGTVYDDCVCEPDAPTLLTNPIPNWCFNPSGDDCSWYTECLEERYPCRETEHSYALDYANKFCNLYKEHYLEFDDIGRQWVDAVRKCLQVKLVPILRPFLRKTCAEIKQMAFDSHPGCYLNPDEGKPSICEIGTANWVQVILTVKSAVIQDPEATFKQMIDVMKACGGEILTDGMELLKLGVEKLKSYAKERLDRISG